MTFVFNFLCGFRPYQPGTCVVFLSGVFLDLCSTWTYEFRLWCNCTLLVGCSVLPARHVTPNSCARNPGRYTFLNIEQRRKHFKGASWGGRLFLQHEAVCPEAVADMSRGEMQFFRGCVFFVVVDFTHGQSRLSSPVGRTKDVSISSRRP